ncbi:MAG: ArnT family glycosyltransferase [Thermodesulfobacteriota bacterium]
MMKEKLFSLWNHPWGQAGLLMAFCFVIYFINLGQWDLWNPDEPRYAQVAREMISGGDWVLMHFNGRIYADKPPLFFWLIAFSSFLWQGFSSFAVRFPSAFFGTLTVLLTFLIGRYLYSSGTGFMAGLILATSIEFAYLSTRANIDATLTFFTTASIFCFIKWYQYNTSHPPPLPEGEREDKRSFTIYGFYIGIALATLAKGPVGFILPLLVSLTFLVIQRDWKSLRQMKLIQGMILFIIIVLSWYMPALLKGGNEYFEETIILHTVDRFAKGSSHIRPFYYYLYSFPVDFLPWIFFLPGAILYGIKKELLENKKKFLFLLVWFISIFIFFSISKGKRGIYLLPLFPAVSLMVGRIWDDFTLNFKRPYPQPWIIYPLYGLIGLSILGGGITPWVVSARFPTFLFYSLPISFLFIGGGIALFILSRLRYPLIVFFLIVGIMSSGFFFTLRVVFPLVNPYKSARFISQEVTSRIRPGEKLAIYGDFVTAPYNFYTGIVPILEIEKREELIRFLQSEQRVFCFMKFRDFEEFQNTEGRPKVELIARRNVGGDDMVVVSNK